MGAAEQRSGQAIRAPAGTLGAGTRRKKRPRGAHGRTVLAQPHSFQNDALRWGSVARRSGRELAGSRQSHARIVFGVAAAANCPCRPTLFVMAGPLSRPSMNTV